MILLFSENFAFSTIQFVLGAILIIAAVIAFIAAFSKQRKQVQFAYHEMHALAMLVYGISILVFCNTVEAMISFTEFLFIFYALSEIIFCNWLFNLGQKVLYRVIFVRLIIGLAAGASTVVIASFSMFKLEAFSLLFILVGINVLLYVPVMKGSGLEEIQDDGL